MNEIGILLTATCSVGLFFLLTRSRLELNRTRTTFWGSSGVILVSLFLMVANVRVIPGGPFVAIHADVLPVVSCLSMSVFAVQAFRVSSSLRRVGLSLTVLSSIAITALAVADVASFYHNRFARGALLGW